MAQRMTAYTSMIDRRQGAIPGSCEAWTAGAGNDLARFLKPMTRAEAVQKTAGVPTNRKAARALKSAMRRVFK